MLRSWVMGEAGKEAGTRDVQPVRRSFWRCYRRRSDFLGFRYGVTVERLLEVVEDVKPDRQKERKGVVREKGGCSVFVDGGVLKAGGSNLRERQKLALPVKERFIAAPPRCPSLARDTPRAA